MPVNSFSMLYSANSFTSNNIKAFGFRLTTCLDSSDPIEPPAPVTITTFSVIFLISNSLFAGTASRPSKSLILTLRKSSILTFPPARSAKLGRTRTVSE